MIIEVKGISEAEGKDSGNKYWKVATNHGNMTAFDEDIAKKLMGCYANGTRAKVTVVETEKGGNVYKNIRAFEGVAGEGEVDFEEVGSQQTITPEKIGTPVKDAGEFNPTSMFVSYAKDIFISLDGCEEITSLQNRMAVAISLVKQAYKEFN